MLIHGDCLEELKKLPDDSVDSLVTDPPRGIVLDPFMGSGSTGLAAKSGGFGFVGIEREQEYLTIAEARIGRSAP